MERLVKHTCRSMVDSNESMVDYFWKLSNISEQSSISTKLVDTDFIRFVDVYVTLTLLRLYGDFSVLLLEEDLRCLCTIFPEQNHSCVSCFLFIQIKKTTKIYFYAPQWWGWGIKLLSCLSVLPFVHINSLVIGAKFQYTGTIENKEVHSINFICIYTTFFILLKNTIHRSYPNFGKKKRYI